MGRCYVRRARRLREIGPRPTLPFNRSSSVSDQAPTAGNLQFERAERATRATGSGCAVCKQVITTTYYEINVNVTCQRYRSRIIAEQNRGSSDTRLTKAP